MTDVPTLTATPEAQVTASPPPPPVGTPTGARSRAWFGVLAAFVALGLLAGATAVLFVRVQEAQDQADEAVEIASTQDALVARIDAMDATLSSLESSGSSTADDVEAARAQVSALRKCVNTAIDAIAQATQSGRQVSVTKC